VGGVKGKNYVRNPYAYPGSWIVRSIWVHKVGGSNSGDYVEIGWCKGKSCCAEGGECIGEPPHFFAFWVGVGVPDEDMLGEAPPWTTHTLNVVRRWDTTWRSWIDGQLRQEN